MPPLVGLLKQQGAIRALGTAVIAAHPQLAQTLTDHGLTLDPVSGEVAELQPFNAVMSKRLAQIRRNLDRLETEWEQAHPGEAIGPVLSSQLQGVAWAHGRPGKKPADFKDEQWWRQELADAGYDPTTEAVTDPGDAGRHQRARGGEPCPRPECWCGVGVDAAHPPGARHPHHHRDRSARGPGGTARVHHPRHQRRGR